MERHEIESAVEGILFASGDPMPAARIAQVLGVETQEVLDCAKALADRYAFEQRGIRLVRMENSLQLCSAPELSDYIIRALEQRKPPRLSQSALEVLAIVAYYQPVTRAYIDQMRGVDSAYTVGVLLDRGLIEVCGKLNVPGRPSVYKTGELFLRTMGIENVEELPQLPDMTTSEGVQKLRDAISALQTEDDAQVTIFDEQEG